MSDAVTELVMLTEPSFTQKTSSLKLTQNRVLTCDTTKALNRRTTKTVNQKSKPLSSIIKSY